MRHIILLILFIEALQAQLPYNHRLENGLSQAFGQLVYELEDSYLGIGRGFDTIDNLRGIYATEFDKETGEILSTSQYNNQGEEYYFNRGNTVIDIFGVPYFIFHGSDTILLSTYSVVDKEIIVKKKIAATIPTSSLFIYDFKYKDGVFYIIAGHSTGETEKVLFNYDIENDILDEIYFYDPEGNLNSPRMQFLENGNYLVTYTRFDSNGAFQYFIEIDPYGNTLWQHKHDGFAEISAQAFIPIDSFNYLIGGYKGRDVPNSADGEGIPFSIKFDYKSKEVVAVSDFEIPDEEWYTWNGAVEEIVPSHDENSFLCVAQLYDFPVDEEFVYSSGMVTKVDKDLNLIWRRTYKYIAEEYRRHWIEDIIATSDGNYLCYGTAQDTYFPPPDIPLLSWAFKIDEDGKIVGDTSTSIIDWEFEEYNKEISIFPNPATDIIYINQDDVEQVTYRVYDNNGKLDDEFEISIRNSSVVKDITNWSSGMKFIQILKDGKVIGSYQLVKQ